MMAYQTLTQSPSVTRLAASDPKAPSSLPQCGYPHWVKVRLAAMCALGPLSITLPTSRRSAANGRNGPYPDSCIAAISVLFDHFVGAAKADIRQNRR
jgi:hypothetical protein